MQRKMPDLSATVAILCSDIHLSQNPPPARAGEPDWFAAMLRPLDEIRDLAAKTGSIIICAGDVFDHWRSSPELINWAIEYLPPMFAIPGQHDLPHHNYNDIKKSAYWTLVEAGKIKELGTGITKCPPMRMHAFPWGFPVKPLSSEQNGVLNVAVIHAYVWAKDHKYTGAPDDAHVSKFLPNLAGYDAVVFGDNHRHFHYHQIWNNGGLMRRKSDEADYKPCVGLLQADGSVIRHYLDINEDVFEKVRKEEEFVKVEGIKEFMEELGTLQAHGLDFKAAIRRYVTDHTTSEAAKALLKDVLDI